MAYKQQLDEIKKKLEKSSKLIEQIRHDVKGTEIDNRERFFLVCENKEEFHPEGRWSGTEKQVPGTEYLFEKGCIEGSLFGAHHTHPEKTKGTIPYPSDSDLINSVYTIVYEFVKEGGISCISHQTHPDTSCYRLKHQLTFEDGKRIINMWPIIKKEGKLSSDDSIWLHSMFDNFYFRYRRPYVSKKKLQKEKEYIEYMKKHGYKVSLPGYDEYGNRIDK